MRYPPRAGRTWQENRHSSHPGHASPARENRHQKRVGSSAMSHLLSWAPRRGRAHCNGCQKNSLTIMQLFLLSQAAPNLAPPDGWEGNERGRMHPYIIQTMPIRQPSLTKWGERADGMQDPGKGPALTTATDFVSPVAISNNLRPPLDCAIISARLMAGRIGQSTSRTPHV